MRAEKESEGDELCKITCILVVGKYFLPTIKNARKMHKQDLERMVDVRYKMLHGDRTWST